MRYLDTTPDSRLADLAARRHGVVSVAQLAQLGLDRWAIARRMKSGRLHRLHRGVYAVGHTALTREGRWLAAVLACGPGALLSHRSAAALWGLRPTSAPKIDVTVPLTSGRRSTDSITVHRGTRRRMVHNNIPTTSPSCTLVDLAAANLPRRQIEKAAETAEALGLLDAREVRGRLKAILAAHDLSTRTRARSKTRSWRCATARRSDGRR